MTAAGAPTGRWPGIDGLRGAMLVLMAWNHIPSVFWRFTHQPLGFPSAAEGFIFLSGLMVGLVYGRKWREVGPSACRRLLFRRALVVYRTHLATFGGVIAWMFLFQAATGRLPVGSPWEFFERPWLTSLATLLLLFEPGLFDVLPLYIGFLVLSPGLFWMLSHGRGGWLLAASGFLWLATQLWVPPHPFLWGLVHTGAFNFTAWQALFVAAVVLAWWQTTDKGGRKWEPRPGVVAVAAALLAACTGLARGWFGPPLTGTDWDWLVNKTNLGVLRVANFFLVGVLVRAWFRSGRYLPVFPPLCLLGRNALPVFATHVVVVEILTGLPEFFAWSPAGPWVGPMVMLAAMVLAALLAERWRRRGRVKPTAASPDRRNPA